MKRTILASLLLACAAHAVAAPQDSAPAKPDTKSTAAAPSDAAVKAAKYAVTTRARSPPRCMR